MGSMSIFEKLSFILSCQLSYRTLPTLLKRQDRTPHKSARLSNYFLDPCCSIERMCGLTATTQYDNKTSFLGRGPRGGGEHTNRTHGVGAHAAVLVLEQLRDPPCQRCERRGRQLFDGVEGGGAHLS